MNTRPTPETDAETMRDEWDHVDSDFGPFGPSDSVPADFARKLERERDEAREALAAEIKHHTETTAKWNGHHMDLTIAQCDLNKAIRERAEARGQRDKLAVALQKVLWLDDSR